MEYRERQQSMTELAFVDEGATYEIDETGIYFDEATQKYVVLSASGCSCWDGDYDEESYDSLDEVEAAFSESTTKNAQGEEWRYHPSLSGLNELMTKAREADAKRG